MDIKPYLKKYAFPLAIVALIWLVVLLMAFRLGLNLGQRKAEFTCQWSENYRRNFGGPPPGAFLQFFDRDDMVRPHGVFGRVIGTATGTLIIKQNDGVETSVAVTDDTVIELLRQRVPLSEAHVNEMAVVIGEPNDQGQIVATFIRLMPPPPDGTSLNDAPSFYIRTR